MHTPFDYSLCDQTVTIYRKEGKTVSRQILKNCYLEYNTRVDTDEYGRQLERRFLLILPGSEQKLQVDDRIYAGQGPEVTAEQWAGFIPVNVEKLMQVQYVQPCYWNGQLCHTEAGRKRTALND